MMVNSDADALRVQYAKRALLENLGHEATLDGALAYYIDTYSTIDVYKYYRRVEIGLC